jgi:hypothetical protein
MQTKHLVKGKIALQKTLDLSQVQGLRRADFAAGFFIRLCRPRPIVLHCRRGALSPQARRRTANVRQNARGNSQLPR